MQDGEYGVSVEYKHVEQEANVIVLLTYFIFAMYNSKVRSACRNLSQIFFSPENCCQLIF
jgi:hypothetical protein